MLGFESMPQIMQVFAENLFINLMAVNKSNPERQSLLVDKALETLDKFTSSAVTCNLFLVTPFMQKLMGDPNLQMVVLQDSSQSK
jgi:hypothetical protein